MPTITVTYQLIWRLRNYPQYQFTADRQCYNTRTGRRIRQTRCGGSIGYCIVGKFHSFTALRPQLEKIPRELCPF
jgi:hypothetical protein